MGILKQDVALNSSCCNFRVCLGTWGFSNRMLRLIVVAATLEFVLGHGNMFHPPAWWDRDSKLRSPASRGCGVLNLGTHNEFSEHHGGKDPDYMRYWYSNNVYIPGHHSLPDDMQQDWVTCHHQVSQTKRQKDKQTIIQKDKKTKIQKTKRQ